LVNAGADINATTRAGDTVLIYAAIGGSLEILTALTTHKAFEKKCITAQNTFGESALDWAIMSGNREATRFLQSFYSKDSTKQTGNESIVREPKMAHNALTRVIYPAISALEKTYKDYPRLLNALSNLKKAFTSLENLQTGISHEFVKNVVTVLKS